MLGFKNFIKAQVNNQRAEQEAVVNNLIQGVGESVVVEDRREALQGLRDAVVEDSYAQSALASIGFPTVCGAIQMDRDDMAVVRTGLECIAAAVAPEETDRDPQRARAAAVNAEQFARTEGAVPMLLELLEVPYPKNADGMHIKFTILQILHGLLEANPVFTQQAILKLPTGVAQLVEMAGDSEVMRNQALLILHKLVAGNPDAQKVAAFSGCFDKLFSVMREEDFMTGGIVVLDCLQLTCNLLRSNQPNQRMFVELGFQTTLLQVLKKEAQALPGEARGMSPERASNLAAALDALQACPADGLIQQADGVAQTLATFAAHSQSPPPVRAAAWSCLATAAAKVAGPAQQAALADFPAEISRGVKVPLVQAAIQESYASQLAAGRQAAGNFFACIATPAAQSSVLKAQLAAHSGSLFQALSLQDSLADLLTSGRAAATLALLVMKNEAVKQEMLGTALPQPAGSVVGACARRLATSVMKHGADREGQELVASFGTLLLALLPGCPPAVEDFLQSISKTPFLVGAVMSEGKFGANGDVVCGICAVLIGLCCIFAPPNAAVDPKTLTKAVVEQITLQRYGKALERLKGALSGEAQPTGRSAWLADAVARVQHSMMALTKANGSGQIQQQQLQQYHQQALEGNTQQHPAAAPSAAQVQAPALPVAHNGFSSKASATAEHAPPPSSFAPRPPPPPFQQQYGHPQPPSPPAAAPYPTVSEAEFKALQNEVQRLNDANARLERDAKDARAHAERAQMALAKAEADLEALSNEYTSLDGQASELQARLDKALARPPAPAPEVQQNGWMCAGDVEALVKAAREEAEADASAAMEDLLVCLGQEEAKVERLEALLAAKR